MKSKTEIAKEPHSRTASRKPQALQIHEVLVPVDFSAPSLAAVEFALPLIKHFGANLHLVHVFARDDSTTGRVMPSIPGDSDINDIRQSVHWRLKDMAEKYSIELPERNIHSPSGRPFDEICCLARNISANLIVIATRGNTGLKHLVLGSTAERVVRYSPCPVLVTRDGEPSGARTGFRKILVPIDFSGCSMEGLAYTQAFAKEFKSKLVLLNSVHFEFHVASDEYARYDLPRLLQCAENAAREQMRDLVEKTDWNSLEVETSLQTGHPGQQICERAEDSDVDLIVTSTHGTTGFQHLLLGSVAEYVVRHAHCPVLVVPSRSSELPIHSTTQK